MNNKKSKIAIITINQPSLNSATILQKYLNEFNVAIYGKNGLQHNLNNFTEYNKLDDILPFAWKNFNAIIFILATGAVVRKISPFLQSKSTDPAILVINLALNRIIPLLSGHLGGANELADIITKKLPNCINFITTATDQTDTISFEMLAKKNGWRIKNLNSLAKISNSLINKKTVNVITYKDIFAQLPRTENLKFHFIEEKIKKDRENQVIICPITKSKSLTLIPKIYLGIGCNRGTSFELIEKAVKLFLQIYSLKIEDVKNIASFEAKIDEIGILEFGKKYNFNIKFFDKNQINSLSNSFSKSASTKFFGLKGVAEPSAVLISQYKQLIIKKTVYFKSITLALSI